MQQHAPCFRAFRFILSGRGHVKGSFFLMSFAPEFPRSWSTGRLANAYATTRCTYTPTCSVAICTVLCIIDDLENQKVKLIKPKSLGLKTA